MKVLDIHMPIIQKGSDKHMYFLRVVFELARSLLVFHTIYHQELYSRRGEFDVRYGGEENTIDDETFPVMTFFSGFTQTKLCQDSHPCVRTFKYSGVSFDQNDLSTLSNVFLINWSGIHPTFSSGCSRSGETTLCASWALEINWDFETCQLYF